MRQAAEGFGLVEQARAEPPGGVADYRFEIGEGRAALGLLCNPSGEALARFLKRHAGAAFHRGDAGVDGGKHFGGLVDLQAGIERHELAQDGLALGVAEAGQFVEDFGHAHGRRLGDFSGATSRRLHWRPGKNPQCKRLDS